MLTPKLVVGRSSAPANSASSSPPASTTSCRQHHHREQAALREDAAGLQACFPSTPPRSAIGKLCLNFKFFSRDSHHNSSHFSHEDSRIQAFGKHNTNLTRRRGTMMPRTFGYENPARKSRESSISMRAPFGITPIKK